jgi:uncharacterized membrane-anchored protein
MRFEERGGGGSISIYQKYHFHGTGEGGTISIYKKYHYHGASLTSWKFGFWKCLYHYHGKFSIWVMVYIAPLKRW